MLSPIKTVFLHYPLHAFITIFLLLVISAIALRILNKKYKRNEITKKNRLVLWLLINYSLFLLFFTVLGRRSLDYYRYNFDFGYSYQEAFLLGDYTLASQIIANILAFVPMGILCFLTAKKFGLLNSFLYGFSLSLFIEAMQLVLRRGYFEFDDMLSNTIGVLIGYIVGKILGSCVKISFKGHN